MLTVDDDEFWADMAPLELRGVPAMQSEVKVVGFPTGGDNVCVTAGVVSRIDRQQYSHGRTSLLAIQVDAAINSGNSGGARWGGDGWWGGGRRAGGFCFCIVVYFVCRPTLTPETHAQHTTP
jgi:hypothetical protein